MTMVGMVIIATRVSENAYTMEQLTKKVADAIALSNHRGWETHAMFATESVSMAISMRTHVYVNAHKNLHGEEFSVKHALGSVRMGAHWILNHAPVLVLPSPHGGV